MKFQFKQFLVATAKLDEHKPVSTGFGSAALGPMDCPVASHASAPSP